MTTKKQQLTNLQNARLSTRPRTQQSKATASHNALKHGLLAKDLVLKDESAAEFEHFRQGFYHTLTPQGCLEDVLIEKIVSSA